MFDSESANHGRVSHALPTIASCCTTPVCDRLSPGCTLGMSFALKAQDCCFRCDSRIEDNRENWQGPCQWSNRHIRNDRYKRKRRRNLFLENRLRRLIAFELLVQRAECIDSDVYPAWRDVRSCVRESEHSAPADQREPRIRPPSRDCREALT